MSDHARLLSLIRARQPCVVLLTLEEQYALSVAREVAVDNGFNLRVWSITRGLADGLIDNAPCEPNTDHPAAALFTLCYNLLELALSLTTSALGLLPGR